MKKQFSCEDEEARARDRLSRLVNRGRKQTSPEPKKKPIGVFGVRDDPEMK